MDYEAVIGLEVHAQIHTQAKMFCGCQVVEDTGDLPPNAYTCPVCLALPGTLPVVNRRAVEMAILTGLALNCTINPENVFARKSYFYPDLPKGYQISQYAMPLASNGYLDVETGGGIKRIGITRAHLEEDTAKLYHQGDGTARVDFNRAGVPLLEIVSEPDMRSVVEVRAYAMALRAILVYLGINSGDMEKGMMRFEANVSVRPVGSKTLGPRAEIKNLNSFRALTRSIAYEIERQVALVQAGGVVMQQTLGWNTVAGQTYVQRSKEYAHDYRYFPEPDIPPLKLESAWIETLRSQLPELPLAKRRRFIDSYGIRRYAAELLVSEQVVADYFEATVRMSQDINLRPQDLANWITGELFRHLNEANLSITVCKVTPEHLVILLFLIQKDTLSVSAAKKVLSAIFESGELPNTVMKRLGLVQISDTRALQDIINAVLDANSKQLGQYLAGKEGVLGWFVGQVMRASKGKANPQQARELLQRSLGRRRSR